MKNPFVSQLSLEVRQTSFIQRMFSKAQGLTFDVIVNGESVYSSWDAGDVKQFCIDNRLNTRMVN